MPEIEKENTESTIDLSTELLIIKAGDSKISKTLQIKATPEIPAVAYQAAVAGSQEITITVKDEATANATIERLHFEGFLAKLADLVDGSIASPPPVDGPPSGETPGVHHSGQSNPDEGQNPDVGGGLGTVTDGEAAPCPRSLWISLEPGKENLAAFREAFKRTKDKDHGNKVALDAAQQAKIDKKAADDAAKLIDKERKAKEKEDAKILKKETAAKLKAEKEAKTQATKDAKVVADLDAIKNKERDRVLKEKKAENQRLEVRIKQDEATLKAINGLIKDRGFSSPEADEEIAQRVAALAADKETLAMNKRAIKKEEDARAGGPPKVEELVEKVEEVNPGVDLTENVDDDEEPIDNDLDGFGPDDSGDELTDDGMLAGM